MQTFEVKYGGASFGIGMILDLTEERATARKESLTRKGKYYVVNTPVTFKQGETVGVVAGGVSKRLMEDVVETEPKPKKK